MAKKIAIIMIVVLLLATAAVLAWLYTKEYGTPQNNGPQEYSSPDNNNPEGPDQGGDNNENVNVETEVHPGTLDKIEDDFLYMENEKFKIDQSTEYLKVTVSQINNDPDGSLEEVNTEIITAKDLEPGDNLLIFTANSKAVTVKKIVE